MLSPDVFDHITDSSDKSVQRNWLVNIFILFLFLLCRHVIDLPVVKYTAMFASS